MGFDDMFASIATEEEIISYNYNIVFEILGGQIDKKNYKK